MCSITMCDMYDMKTETTIIKYIFYFILNGKYTQFNLLLVCMVFVSGRRAVLSGPQHYKNCTHREKIS